MNYKESWIEQEFRLCYENFKQGSSCISDVIGFDPLFTLEQEYPIQMENRKIYFVDFFQPDTKLVIELDGFNYHHTPKQLLKDFKKDADLKSIGFTVMRIPGARIRREIITVFSEVYNKYCSLVFVPEDTNE